MPIGVGCASSCCIFEMLSTALMWVARKHFMTPHLMHILDDYLMAVSTYHQCHIHLVCFLSVCKYLGVPIAPEKTVGPQNIPSFAGIEKIWEPISTSQQNREMPVIDSVISSTQKSYFAGNTIFDWSP